MPTTYDPNDAREVRTKEQLVKLREQNLAEQLRVDTLTVMSTPEGRRWIHGLLKDICAVHAFPYVPGGHEAERDQTYKLGKQAVGLDILDKIQTHAADETAAMTAEARAFAKHIEDLMVAEDEAAAGNDDTGEYDGR